MAFNRKYGIITGLLAAFLAVVATHGIAQTRNRNLNDYLEAAVRGNPLLREAGNTIKSYGLDSQKIAASLGPQVTGMGAYTLSPVIGGVGFDPVITNISPLSALVNVSRDYVSKGNLDARNAALRLLASGTANDAKITEQDLRRTVTAQYLTVYADLRQADYYRQLLEAMQAAQPLVKTLTEGNVYRQTDFLAFEVTLKQQELQIHQLAIQTSSDFATLNYLCGISDTSTYELSLPAMPISTPPNRDTSVFFLHYNIAADLLQNERINLNYAYKPKAGVYANAGYLSSLQYRAWENFGYNFGVNVSVPIYDGHRKKMEEAKIQLRENTNAANKEWFAAQYDMEVNHLQGQLAATDALIDEIRVQVAYTEALVEADRKLLGTGDVRIADFVLALNANITAQYLLTQNTVGRLQIINQINYRNR